MNESDATLTSTMPSIINRSFRVNLSVMRILGLYPTDTYKKIYQMLTYVLYFLLMVPVPILQCLNLYTQKNLSFKIIADNTFLIAELGCFLPKFWPFVKYGGRIKRCIHYFDSPYFKTVEKGHEGIINDCIKVCKSTTAFFFTAVSTGFSSWSSRPIFWEGHTFPTDIWLPFDAKSAPKSYIAGAYTYLVMAVGYGAYTSAAVDSLIAGLAYQATCQIKILKHNLMFLEESVAAEMETCGNSTNRIDLLHKKIKQCSIHYNYILDFVKEYEACFSQVAFSQFAGGVVVFCVSCLQLTILDILSFDFLAMMMYFIAMFSEVYLYCHFGTILYEESNTIRDAVYLGTWYEFDIESKKSLMIIMERSKIPIVVRCGKIFDMSLVTFTMILRRSYSLLAVLENYNIGLN